MAESQDDKIDKRWLVEYPDERATKVFKNIPFPTKIDGQDVTSWVSYKDYKDLRKHFDALLATALEMSKDLERCSTITNAAVPGVARWQRYLNRFRDHDR